MGSLPVCMGQQERSTLPCTTLSFGSMLCSSVLLGQPLVWPVLPYSCEQAETARPEELVETIHFLIFLGFLVLAALGRTQLGGLMQQEQHWHTVTHLPLLSLSVDTNASGKALLPASVTSHTMCWGSSG